MFLDMEDKKHFWLDIVGIFLCVAIIIFGIHGIYDACQEKKSTENDISSQEIEYHDYEIIDAKQTILMVDGETLDSSIDVTVMNKDTNTVYTLNVPEDTELHFAFRATQEQFKKEFGDYIVNERKGG